MRRCACSECCLLYVETVFLFLVAEKARVGVRSFVRPVTDKEVKPKDVQASHTLACAFNFCPALLAILGCYGLLYFGLLGTHFSSPRAGPCRERSLDEQRPLFFFTSTLFFASLSLQALCAFFP